MALPDGDPSRRGRAGHMRRRFLNRPSSDGRKTVLHVGCGPPDPAKLDVMFHGPDWRELRFDIDPGVKPDIVGTIVGVTNVKDESVDAVWSSHNIEHIHAHEVPLALRGFFRVLRPGGFTLIATPDLQWAAALIAKGNLERPILDSDLGEIAPLDIVYGHRGSIRQGNEFMAHHTGFTAKTLGTKLREAGFEDVSVTRNDFELRARGRRPA
jgi:SAM-dependent methyltransferase